MLFIYLYLFLVLLLYFHERGFVVKKCSNTFVSHTEVDFDDVFDDEELVEWLMV